MTKFNLKSIFSAPLIFFSPLKKLKLNGFLGGLIFGAIFSLVVNMVTVQVQEKIQKQRILEAVENEILNNTLQAKSIYDQNIKNIKEDDVPNIYHPFTTYSNDLWTQSTEPLQYISQLDPETQTAVILYYSLTIKHINNMVNKYEDMANSKLKDCYWFSTLNNTEKDTCRFWNENILKWESETALDMAQYGFDLLNKFHPTQDRLNSPLLKLFMGNKSTKILSGEQ